MTTVKTTVTVSKPEDGMALEVLKGLVAQAINKAGQDLLQQACRAIEDDLLHKRNPGIWRDKRRPLHLLTSFGWIRLMRWQMWDGQRCYCYLLDDVLGLGSRQHASPRITTQAVALATRLSYRQAAQLLSEIIDHRTLYRPGQDLRLGPASRSPHCVRRRRTAGSRLYAWSNPAVRSPSTRDHSYRSGWHVPVRPTRRDFGFRSATAVSHPVWAERRREEHSALSAGGPRHERPRLALLAGRTVGVLTTGKVLESRTTKPCTEPFGRLKTFGCVEGTADIACWSGHDTVAGKPSRTSAKDCS